MEGIRKISISDKEYPKLLKKIEDPPEILYIKGKIFPEDFFFAVVGTRRFSSYGKQLTSEITGELAEAGLTIVSGLAPGIDTFAHQAAVEQKKRTIAVLGTGLDEKSIYPKENLKLVRKILDNGGALISEYPPETRGTNFTFPQRNRIISGISFGMLVVEAKSPLPDFWQGNKEKSGSGSLITARYAFKQKRKVFAIPGSIHSLNSRGCHFLIKQGAKLVESANDILEELNLPQIKNKKEISGETKEESLILEALKTEPLYIDRIIAETNLSPSIVSSTLAIMEIKGKVKNLGTNIYALRR